MLPQIGGLITADIDTFPGLTLTQSEGFRLRMPPPPKLSITAFAEWQGT